MTEGLSDPEMEKSILGIIANTASLDLVRAASVVSQSGLTKEVFHVPHNRTLFGVFEWFLKTGQPIDALSVKAELATNKTPVPWEYLVEVTMGSNSLHESQLLAYADRLKTLATKRTMLSELRAAAVDLQKLDADANAIAGQLSARMVELSATGKRVTTLTDSLMGVVDHIQQVHDGKKEPIVRTGIKSLDDIIGGFQPTLNMVGALPGVGKSAFAATCAVNIAKAGIKIGVFSLEDAAEWISWRLLSKESGITQHKLRFTPLPGEQFGKLDQGITRLQAYANNIYLVDGSDTALAPDEIARESTNLVLNHGVRCIMIDHLGEIKLPYKGERYDLVLSDCLSTIRHVANRFHIPVVVFSHLVQREGLSAADEPKLSDFAGGASTPRKARVALGLSRAPDSDEMTISALKNTNGVAGYKTIVEFVGWSAMLKAAS